MYWSYKSFVRAQSFFGKLAWGIAGLIGLSIALSHSPALIGIAALVVLYYGYREWKKEKDVVVDSLQKVLSHIAILKMSGTS
ncbi:hypothetical protein bcere0022_47760 [Bacillus cereus Rock3-44]|nr:hypothetical protein bcere0022_47760 [Bacillus cereus Rock3-44]